MQDLTSTLIGKTLGSYRVTRLLGEGGMGLVLLGEHTSLKRKAAIKVLRPELAQRDEVVQRFFNEALAANQIKHPGIVDIYDYAQSDAGAYLVMEFLDGEPLSDLLLREKRLSLESVVLLVRRIASPLTAAHAEEIIHRDLKPDNIFILPDPDHPGDVRVKLLDFGIAKLKESGQPSMRTATGMLLGTPFYMSPEQCHGAKLVDHRSDIYALAVIAYELLSGRLPFTAEGLGELVLKHQTEAPPPLGIAELGIPEAVEAQLQRALAKDPVARFDSATEFADALMLASGVQHPGMTLPPLTPVHREAELAGAETAVKLPHTVMSEPGLAIAPGITPQPTPQPALASQPTPQPALAGQPTPQLALASQPTPQPALASQPTPQPALMEQPTPADAVRPVPPATALAPGRTGPLPQQSRGISKTGMLAIVGILLLLGTIAGAVYVIVGADDKKAAAGSAGTGDGTAATAAAGTSAGSGTAGGVSAEKRAKALKAVPKSPDDAPMALIPAGPFRYGKAKREVVLGAFEIDRHEVTVAQYRRCVAAGGCDGRKVNGVELPGQVPFSKSKRCNAGHGDRASHPQNCVTHAEAAAYCVWAKKRLPREAEWAKAARSTNGRRLPWGNEVLSCDHAVFNDHKGKGEGCGKRGSWPVGSRSPRGDSAYGVRDLLGNVAEWVGDRWAVDAPEKGPAKDPQGPKGGKRWTVRGGSFTSKDLDDKRLDALTRIGLPPTYRLEDIGFRCARSR